MFATQEFPHINPKLRNPLAAAKGSCIQQIDEGCLKNVLANYDAKGLVAHLVNRERGPFFAPDFPFQPGFQFSFLRTHWRQLHERSRLSQHIAGAGCHLFLLPGIKLAGGDSSNQRVNLRSR